MSTEVAVTTASQPALVPRSLGANWNYARWFQLPADGNRYTEISVGAAPIGGLMLK